MKLYNDNDPAPNPRRVRIFLLEKGLDVELVHTPLFEGKHKTPEFLAKNSLGQLPVLELDDGTTISESVAICRYLEAAHPTPPLFGHTPLEIGRIDMWIRRVEFRVMMPAGMIWVHAHPFTAAYAQSQGWKQFTEFGQQSFKVFAGACRWLDGELAGREFLASDSYSMADIILQTTLDFGGAVGIDLPEDCKNVREWYARVSKRPSAKLDLGAFPVELARKSLLGR